MSLTPLFPSEFAENYPFAAEAALRLSWRANTDGTARHMRCSGMLAGDATMCSECTDILSANTLTAAKDGIAARAHLEEPATGTAYFYFTCAGPPVAAAHA